VKHIQQLLSQIGLEPERVRMFNMSAAMASQFVAATEEMTKLITNLGPNPLSRYTPKNLNP
jgi:coenzyme F420-reducing hydrogenase delta subunit